MGAANTMSLCERTGKHATVRCAALTERAKIGGSWKCLGSVSGGVLPTVPREKAVNWAPNASPGLKTNSLTCWSTNSHGAQ